MIVRTRQTEGFGFAILLCGFLGSAAAQGIYTCVDDKGNKLTSDRPIAACMDRPQRELNPSGTVRRVLTPPPPPKTQEELLAQEKADSQIRLERRRDLDLRIRYPDRDSHDKARAAALETVDEAIKTATKRSQELTDQRKAIDVELDFYKSSPGKVPASIKRRIDETDANLAGQKRLIADKEAEKKRNTDRFDAEFAKLKARWGLVDTASAAAPASSAKKP